MLFIDRNYGGVFFDPGEGGAPLLYEHFAWFFFTGAYMLVLIVAGGVISDVLPTFARKPLFSHRGAMLSLLAIAVLGPLAWMQNMYTAPIPIGFEIFAMLFALALAVPIGLLIFNWIATLWGGTLHLRAAPLFALGAISSMTIGLAGELAYSVLPVGWQLDNTTAAQGDTIAVLVGGAVLGGFAALHYWFPKLTGRTLGEGAGKIAFSAIIAGVYVYALATFLAGLKAQPVDIYKYFAGNGAGRLQPRRLDRRLRARRGDPGRARRTSPIAGGTGCAPATTRGAPRRSSGSRSRLRRSTTSTSSPTCAAPSPCTTSAGRSASAPRRGARRPRPRRRRPAPARPSRSAGTPPKARR